MCLSQQLHVVTYSFTKQYPKKFGVESTTFIDGYGTPPMMRNITFINQNMYFYAFCMRNNSNWLDVEAFVVMSPLWALRNVQLLHCLHGPNSSRMPNCFTKFTEPPCLFSFDQHQNGSQHTWLTFQCTHLSQLNLSLSTQSYMDSSFSLQHH